MGPKLMVCCKMEQVGTKAHGKMQKHIQVLEEGRVPANKAKNWNIEGQKRKSSSVSERTGRPVEDRTGRPVMANGQELNVGNAQIRTLLDRQKEQIFAECQAEIKKHEFQAN